MKHMKVNTKKSALNVKYYFIIFGISKYLHYLCNQI